MNRLAVLTFSIGLLGMPIHAQAQQRPALVAPFRIDRESPEVEQQRAAQQYQQYLAQQQYRRYLAQQQYLAQLRYQQYLAQQAQVTNCVRFSQNAPNAEAEVRFLTSHPNARVCPVEYPDPPAALENRMQSMQNQQSWSTTSANNTIMQMRAASARRY